MGKKANHSVSARLPYLASDRPDIAFACTECSRAVGKATRADLTRLKRIGRYLLHPPRALTLLVARRRGARHLEDACALVNTPWQLGRQHREWCH